MRRLAVTCDVRRPTASAGRRRAPCFRRSEHHQHHPTRCETLALQVATRPRFESHVGQVSSITVAFARMRGLDLHVNGRTSSRPSVRRGGQQFLRIAWNWFPSPAAVRHFARAGSGVRRFVFASRTSATWRGFRLADSNAICGPPFSFSFLSMRRRASRPSSGGCPLVGPAWRPRGPATRQRSKQTPKFRAVRLAPSPSEAVAWERAVSFAPARSVGSYDLGRATCRSGPSPASGPGSAGSPHVRTGRHTLPFPVRVGSSYSRWV